MAGAADSSERLYSINKAAAVVPADGPQLVPAWTRALHVGTGGDVAVLFENDTVVVTLKNVPSGSVLPYSVQKVMSTNTTASNIVALR